MRLQKTYDTITYGNFQRRYFVLCILLHILVSLSSNYSPISVNWNSFSNEFSSIRVLVHYCEFKSRIIMIYSWNINYLPHVHELPIHSLEEIVK